MVESLLHTAPHVTTVFEADLSAVLADRSLGARSSLAGRATDADGLLRAGSRGGDPGRAGGQQPLDRRRAGDLRVHAHRHRDRRRGDGADGACAARCDRSDLFETAAALHGLVERARTGRLATADVRGGTFTISNHGVSGSLLAAPIIINQPQSAILGVGKLERRPVVQDGAAGRKS